MIIILQKLTSQIDMTLRWNEGFSLQFTFNVSSNYLYTKTVYKNKLLLTIETPFYFFLQ